MKNIAAIRKDYSKAVLDESKVDASPFVQFGHWWHEVLASEVEEVNAMTLATADAAGKPSARIVLLKGYDEKGFVFFTNYESRKGRELLQNPRACLVFFWKELERQVRIDGSIEKISPIESDEYFFSRPVESQIGAWCSPQSQVIDSREIIETNVTIQTERFRKEPLQRPPHWGGYRVVPESFEFWQGRPSRLHDRIQYQKDDQAWTIRRLAP